MIIEPSSSADDAQRIAAILVAHNNLHTPATSREPFCLVARDAGTVIGGALGWTAHRWCYVDILTLVPDARGTGQGALLLTAVESLARDRNCIGVYLFSYSFQAPSFYERFGYTLLGRIEDLPPGHSQIWLSKRLT